MKTFDRSFRIYILCYLLVVALMCFLPILFSLQSPIGIDFSNTGEIGDTIGGIMGPFIAIAASLLTFLAFWVQYKANIQQRQMFNKQLKAQKNQFEAELTEQRDQLEKELTEQRLQRTEQEKTWKIEQFESKYYELLRLHRANVEEINIGGKVHGRKAFGAMFYEYKACFILLENIYSEGLGTGQEFTPEQLGNISFKVFYYGIGENSNIVLEAFFKDEEKILVHYLGKRLQVIQRDYNAAKKDLFVHDIHSKRGKFRLRLKYYPFDGHSTKLGHYFRHLFQTVDFVAKSPLFTRDEKYQYLKTLRAQLSNHEQLLLYYDALSDFGRKWITEKYLTDYRLIRNIPIPMADFGMKPQEKFAQEIEALRETGKEFFEWYER